MQVLRDFQLTGTPFRGLILRGPYSLCAYIGVPQDHWLADMEELSFRCHWGITFRGPGDGDHRPAQFYWYGWDYGHPGDQLLIDEQLPQEVKNAFDRMFAGGTPRPVETVELDIVDVAQALQEALDAAESAAQHWRPRIAR